MTERLRKRGQGPGADFAAYVANHAAGDTPKWFADLLAEREVAAVIPAVIPKGQRNHTLASFAGSMRRAGADEDTILAGLRVMNRKRCQPPLDDGEVRKIANSIATNYAAGAQTQSTWLPADNDVVLDGDLSPLEPTCMIRADGQRLLYPDRVHDFHGEPETLKSFGAQVAAAQELINGGTVAWIDHESEARDVYGHLLALGVSKDRLRNNFIYVRPEEPIDDAVITQLGAILTDRKPTLTVIDGENNSLALSGYDPNSNKEVRLWWDRLVRRLQLAKVGAIVLIDHVVKNQQQQGRWAVGAGQKLAGIDGASFGFELIQAFGRGRTGMVKIKLHKDRPGALRGKAAGQTIAVLRLTSHEADDHIDFELLAPPQGEGTGTPEGKDWKPTGLMEIISKALEKAPEPLSQTGVESRVNGTAAWKRRALLALIDQGYVEVTKGPRNAVLHRSVKPYRDPAALPPPDHKFGAEL